MCDENGSDAPLEGAGKQIMNVGVADLRYAKTAEEIGEIGSIHDVGVILISEELVGALAKVNVYNVGGVMAVPSGDKVNVMTGQTRLTGEALEGGDPETTLVLVGQTFITTPVRSVGYKELRFCGQLFATRGSEAALTPKIGQMTGQNFFLPPDPRIIMGEETIGAEFLELLPKPTALVIMGEVTFDADVSKELLLAKIEEIVLMGEIQAPAHLIAALQVITKEKMGEINQHDA